METYDLLEITQENEETYIKTVRTILINIYDYLQKINEKMLEECKKGNIDKAVKLNNLYVEYWKTKNNLETIYFNKYTNTLDFPTNINNIW